MPIGAFTKALSGDIRAVSRNRFYVESKLKAFWEILFSQHLDRHGLPQNYIDYMAMKQKAIVAYNQAINKGESWMIVKAKIYDREADNLMLGESESIEVTCARISKFLGFPVKADQCSVSEFYAYTKLMS